MAIEDALKTIERLHKNTREPQDYTTDVDDILSTRQENDSLYVFLANLTLTINSTFKAVSSKEMTEILTSALQNTQWESVPVVHIEAVSKAENSDSLDWHLFLSDSDVQEFVIALSSVQEKAILYWTQTRTNLSGNYSDSKSMAAPDCPKGLEILERERVLWRAMMVEQKRKISKTNFLRWLSDDLESFLTAQVQIGPEVMGNFLHAVIQGWLEEDENICVQEANPDEVTAYTKLQEHRPYAQVRDGGNPSWTIYFAGKDNNTLYYGR